MGQFRYPCHLLSTHSSDRACNNVGQPIFTTLKEQYEQIAFMLLLQTTSRVTDLRKPQTNFYSFVQKLRMEVMQCSL